VTTQAPPSFMAPSAFWIPSANGPVGRAPIRLAVLLPAAVKWGKQTLSPSEPSIPLTEPQP